VLLVTFWHLAEQKKADRHRLHRSRPRVLPQLLQSAGGGASVACIVDPLLLRCCSGSNASTSRSLAGFVNLV